MSNLVERSLMNVLEERIKNNSIVSVRKNELVPHTDTEKENLREDQKEIIHYALNRESKMPKFKMRHFVGDAQVTPYAKLKQFLLELRVREENLAVMTYDVRKFEIELKILKKKYQDETDELQKELHSLEIERKERGLFVNKKSLDDVYKERQSLLELIDEFNNSDEGKLPDGRLIIEVLSDPEYEEYLEKELWTARLAKQSAVDLATSGRIGNGNLDAIIMLPPEQQVQVLAIASDYGTRVQSTMNVLSQETSKRLQLKYENQNVNLSSLLKFEDKIDANNLLEHEEK